MSLISDALKKARQEAARQDAAQRGLPYAVGGADAKRPSALAGPLVTGLAAGAVLVGAGALAAYLGHWGPWREPGRERLVQAPPSAAAQAAPAPPASPETGTAVPAAPEGQAPPGAASVPPGGVDPARGASAGGDPSIAIRPAAPPAPVTPPAQAPAQRPEARPAPVTAPAPSLQSAPSRVAPTAPPPSAPVPQVPRSAPPSDATALEEGGEERVYSNEVPVPGGGTLRLSGIAFSDNPVAVIDGKIVGRGEVVQGFTVVEIQRGRVRLQGHGQNVVVSIR